MKKTIFSVLSIAALSCLSFSSCNSEENEPQIPQQEVIPEGYVKHSVTANVPELSRTRAEDPFAALWPALSSTTSDDTMTLQYAIYSENGTVFKTANVYFEESVWSKGNIGFDVVLPANRKFKIAALLIKGSEGDYKLDAANKTIGLGSSIADRTARGRWSWDDLRMNPSVDYFPAFLGGRGTSIYSNHAAGGDAFFYYGELPKTDSQVITLKRPFVQVIVLSDGSIKNGFASLGLHSSDDVDGGETDAYITSGYNFETDDVINGATFASIVRLDHSEAADWATNVTNFDGAKKVTYNGRQMTVVGNFYLFASKNKTMFGRGGTSMYLEYQAYDSAMAHVWKNVEIADAAGALTQNTRYILTTSAGDNLFEDSRSLKFNVDSSITDKAL